MHQIFFAHLISFHHDPLVSETSQQTLLPVTSLEIQVELEQRRRRDQKRQTKQDLEIALRRKINRNLKDRQLLLHKASLLCHFGRAHYYNRLLNDTDIMQKVLPFLPSQNAYPPQSGTEIKYFISFTTWFKTTIKLMDPRMYPVHPRKKLKRKYLKQHLIEQIKNKKACCKQDMIFMYVALLRGMGLQCRLVCNLQPLPMRPAQSDLLSIKLKDDAEENKEKATNKIVSKKDKSSDESSKKLEENKSQDVKKEKSKKTTKKEKQNASEGEIEVEQENELKKRAKRAINQIADKNDVAEKMKEEKPLNISTKSKQNENNEAKKLKLESVEQEKRTTRTRKNLNNQEDIKIKDEGSQKGNNRRQSNNKESIKKELEVATHNKMHVENAQEMQDVKVENVEELKVLKMEVEHAENKAKISTEEETTKNLNVQRTEGNPKNAARVQESKQRPKTRSRSTLNAKTEDENEKEAETIKNKETATRSKTILKDKQNTNTVRVPEIIEPATLVENPKRVLRRLPSRSVSPKIQISPKFLQTEKYMKKISPEPKFSQIDVKKKPEPNTVKIKLDMENTGRVLRQRNKNLPAQNLKIPQLDGADDGLDMPKETKLRTKRLQLKKLNKSRSKEESDDDFQPSPPKQAKAPKPEKKSRAVLSSDEEECEDDAKNENKSPKKHSKATDIWVEVWSDKEETWVCIDIFTAKVHSVEAIRKAASSNMSYVYAFQNDLSIKDVTARYCMNWSNVLRKSRVDKSWLDTALSSTHSKKTKRDIMEDQELRRLHEEKPLPTTISEFKDHPFYALERHLLKFQAIYPPNAPTLGFIRKEPVYSRDCVHTLHSREIWHRLARVVKPGEQAYKVVKARPKWDKHTQTIIKDQPPLDIFGYWQTKQYEPPVAENGIVPRNEYGNVELFKECMLPKNCVHLRLPGLQRICKKLGIDCASAVVGFDFHQGACHPEYDGFIVCEEFKETVVEAWNEDQLIQEQKERDKYEARVYGNWKKLIKGLFIRERLKTKYNY